MPLDREPVRVCPILWLFRFWVQASAFFVGRPFQAVKKPPEKTAWKGRPHLETGEPSFWKPSRQWPPSSHAPLQAGEGRWELRQRLSAWPPGFLWGIVHQRYRVVAFH